MADDYSYHIDHHGSLIRPPGLAQARAAGDPEAWLAAVDDAVVAAAHLQRRLTLSAVCDGQFRREHFESVVYDHVDGFGPAAEPNALAQVCGIKATRRRTVEVGLRSRGRLAQLEAATVLTTVDRPVFVALPSPGYLALLASSLMTAGSLDQVESFGSVLADIIRAEIEALASDGVAYVLLGNPLYAPLLTVAGRARLAADGMDIDPILVAAVAADRAVFDGLDVPATFRVGLDLADQGPLPTTEEGYDPVSLGRLLDETPYQRLCVDFPEDPKARFPLDRVRPGVVVSVGLVDVSRPTPESIDDLLASADAVIDQRGLDDVAFSTNGGFASSATEAPMSADEERDKLRLVEMVARYYWGNEI